MRHEELNLLKEPYEDNEQINRQQRFDSRIGSDIPAATALAAAILNDLEPTNFGVYWWGDLPKQERILIGDYLYQSIVGIAVNLSEARLHLFEWLHAVE